MTCHSIINLVILFSLTITIFCFPVNQTSEKNPTVTPNGDRYSEVFRTILIMLTGRSIFHYDKYGGRFFTEQTR